MQNKGLIKTFAILLALVCVYQLTFTFKAKQVERDAREYAQGDATKERNYLDSIAGEEVYNLLGIRSYTYKEVKEQVILFPKSLAEQQIIVSKLDSLAEETKKLENTYKQKLANLEELKKSILKKAFSGEL